MLIHADFSQAVIVKPEDYHWVKSPRGEVDRVMLDRIGDEIARATSLVKYAPHTTFLNIDIIMVKKSSYFQAYLLKIKISTTPAGWYLRSPHQSVHQPSSEEGTLILSNLCKFLRQKLKPTNQYQ